MKVNILVHCQYYENYNVGPDGFGEVPYWKPKGGCTFKMPIDSDTIFYSDKEVLETAIKALVEKQNSIAEKFEYSEHQFEMDEPMVLEGLEEMMDSVMELNS